jgi:hypothetical protein
MKPPCFYCASNMPCATKAREPPQPATHGKLAAPWSWKQFLNAGQCKPGATDSVHPLGQGAP